MYLSEKFRSHDRDGRIRVGQFKGQDAILITSPVKDEVFVTCIYAYDGYLRELYLEEELLEEAGDEFGVAGIVKNPMDADGLADAMEIFCNDKDKCETYGRNGMARVFKYFTHELMMSRYFDLYKEVL